MATGFNDALQLFQGGTGTGVTTDDNTLELPEGSETLSDLIKLNYDFPVEPNIPTPQTYNIYVWNNNTDGEIRFYTKDAKNNNDYNKDYFSGNYTEPRLNFNTKIGKNGKLYYWHNYTALNPAKLSGWVEIDDNFNSVEFQLTALDVTIAALGLVQTSLQNQIGITNVNVATLTGALNVTDQTVLDHEVRITYLEYTTENETFDYDFVGDAYDPREFIREAKDKLEEFTLRSLAPGTVFSDSLAYAKLRARNTFSNLLYGIVTNSVTSIAIVAFAATVYGILKEILDADKKQIYTREMIVIGDTLGLLPVSQNNNTLNHTGLTIVSGNGGFPAALPNREFTVPIQRNAILKFGIDSSFNAYLITVEQYGETFFTVGETININKNLINGGTGTLVLIVSSLGTLKQWSELRLTYLQNKINKINTKSRRKNFVIGHDDINTDQFTNVDATYTDYDEQGAEIITYKVLKSRINLLPTGTNDVDLYTLTGKIGIGTTPTTKLHIFDNLTNETKLTIQNTSNILLETLPSSSIDLNITNNTVVDYNLGNYNGNFKVISKNEGVTTDQMIIDSSGRIGIGTNPSAVHKLYVNGGILADRYVGFNVNVGKLSNIELNVYKATNPTIRIESDEAGTPILEFMRGTNSDINKDYRFISQSDILKLQFQDNLTLYGADTNQLLWFDNTKTIIYKEIECKSNVGIGTDAATTDLLVYKNTNPIVRVQSLAEGTPIIEFTRGVLNDTNKDYRFVSQSDTLKLQYQDNFTSYGNNINQLIWANDTDMIIHKATELKANLLIGGDTRTIGYVGIGTTASTSLHVYTAAANILRLQTAPVDGTNSIEFMRGNSSDPLTDYRLLTDTAGKFKIQYANNELVYGAAGTDLIELSTTNTIIYKPTELKGNVGIGTAPHATYKVNVNGTTQSTAFIGNGAGLTDLGADKITTGSLNLDRITLTTSKLYQNFNQTNFAIIDDKIDLPPNYSINITDYDSQTLFGLSTERKYKGKITANYDDRNGVYKLITTDNRTNNVAVLNYKVGDKISIRNTATVANDYLLESGSRYYNSLLLIKRPNNIPLNWAVNDAHNVLLYEWFSSDGLEGRPEARVRTPTNRYFPFTTVMTFLIEAGFNYYLCKLYNTVEVSGSSLIVVASGYGDDYNDFNRAFGAGQTFKLQITGATFADDYLPTEYIGADIGIASDRRLGGVKKGRGVAIDETTGALDATPVSVDLINSMNTSHFTNNTGTNKIDISSTYVAPSATKLATARNIAGTAFDGTENINITYGNLSSIPATWAESQIPNLGAGKITSGTFSTDRIPDLGAGKITSGVFSTDRIPDLGAGKITSGVFSTDRIPDLGTVKITSGTFDILRIPDLGTGKITSGTFDILRIPDLGTGKITSGTFDILRIPDLGTGKITSGTFDILRIPDMATGKITSGTFATDRIPDLAISKISGLQGALDAKQATLTAGTGISILGTTISSTTFTPTSANLIGSFNATQFVNNTGTSKIDIDVNWKPTTCSIADSAMQLVSSRNIAGVAFNGTTSIAIPFANIDGLTAELATKQATINSTAGQLIIGNGNGATTINGALTYNSNLLSTSNLAVSGTASITGNISTNGIITIGAGGDISLPANTSSAIRWGTGVSTMFGRTITAGVYSTSALAGDAVLKAQNNLHIQSGDGAAAITIATTNNNVGIGITNPNASYKLDVVGDINITGAYRVNGALFSGSKWTTATDTTRIFYSNGNVGIGTNNPLSIFQVGTSGGRFKVSNGVSDFSTLGTNDVDGSANTKIVVSGNTRVGNIGNIEYYATSTGGHLFYTNGVTQQMQISNTGNVGIGTTSHGTYRVNVNGSLNATSVLVNGSPVGGGLSQGMVVQMKHLTYTQMDVKNNTGWDAINDNLTTGFVIAITPSSTSSKVLVNMIAHIGTNDNSTDSRWWGIKLYRKIGAGGAWTEITGANGTETGAAAITAGTPVWISHNLGSVVADVAYSYFVANVTGTYLDAPNTTSIVYYTAYWNQRLGDGINAISGNIYINRSHNHGDGFRPAPSSSWTATEIWDLGTPYVPPVGDNTITISSGNVGVGTGANASYKLNVEGAINALQKIDIQGTNPTLRLLDTNSDGNAIIQFRELNDFYGMDIAYIGNTDNKMYIRSYNNSTTPVNNITIDRGSGNVGLGTTNPIYKCHIKCTYDNAATGIHLDAGETNTDTNKYTLNISPYVIAGGEVGWRFRTQNFTGGTHTPLTLNNYGNVVVQNNLTTGSFTTGSCVANSYMISFDQVVGRGGGYDTAIKSNSGGMFLLCSNTSTQNGDFLMLGAFNGMTAIDSGAGRMIRMRVGTGLSWEFNTNSTTWNAKGSTTWDAPSDHRIKEDIKKANLKICYDNVKNINLYRFKYIDGFKEATKQDRTQLGYIAQQVKQHFPKSVQRSKTRIEDKREIPDLASVDISQVNFTLFGAVKQLMRVVEKQSKRIKKLEEMLNIIDDDEVEDDADEPYIRINCEDEVNIDDIEPSEPTEV